MGDVKNHSERIWRRIHIFVLIFNKDFRMEEDNIDTEPPPSYATVTQEILLKSII